MKTDLFRKLALSLPETEEKSHFAKPDFRVRNKIFAGFSGEGRGYVKLAPEQQDFLVAAEPHCIEAHKGHWGRMGWTWINIEKADEAMLQSVLHMAWRNVAPKSLKQ